MPGRRILLQQLWWWHPQQDPQVHLDTSMKGIGMRYSLNYCLEFPDGRLN